MEHECKVMLDSKADTDDRKQKPSSKLTTALMLFALCLAAAATVVLIFNRSTKGSETEQDNFDLHHTLRQISNVRAAIHLQGEYNPEIQTSVDWKNDVDQTHSQGGLELINNEIVIPRHGLYFVYSQASFRFSCSGDADDANSSPMVHLSHSVRLWSPSYGDDDSYQTILHSIRTACQKTASSDLDEDGKWFTAVYMGAVFNLMKGDRLSTVMEQKMLEKLEDEPGKTFFGVFAL
ncbi:tumor necrosis factor a (TNF superfamily, member 2) [Pholidichthys leucotaenia]